MKRALLAILTLAIAASLLLLLPVTAQAFDDGTQCMQAQSGKHDFESRNYVAPTCTSEGSRTWVCRRCGHEATETIPMTEHRIQLQTDVEPTCTTPGSATRRCVDCGITASRPQTLPALGHNYQVIEQVPDTCETAGYTLSACSRCKETLREEGKPLGHSPVTLPGVSATCTASGLTEGSQCSRCGQILTAQETIPALGHNWSTRGEVAQEPTCTADGVMRYPCQRCDAYRTEAIAALGHSPVTLPAVTATCTTAGKTEGSQCSRCGAVLTAQQVIPATGHTWDGGSVTESPSCIETGVTTYACLTCKATRDETIPALGHSPVFLSGKEATCTESGLTEGSQCSRCGAVLTAQKTIPALGHSPAAMPGKAATCTESGLTEGSQCSRCGTVLTAQKTIPALGHSPVSMPGSAATCTESGLTEGSRCSRCGAMLTAQKTIPALGHSPVSMPGSAATCTESGLTEGSQCSRCGAVLTAQKTIPPLGHRWGDWQVETEGTCIQQGMNVRRCAQCGAEEYAYSGYGDHDWGAWETVTEPTGRTDGLRRRVCRNDFSHVEQEIIPATGIHPSLAVTFLGDDDEHNDPYPAGQDTFDASDGVYAHFNLVNTGDVPLLIVCHYSFEGGPEKDRYEWQYHPGDSYSNWVGWQPIGQMAAPGTETDDLAGVVSFSFYLVGYDPDGFVFDEAAGAVVSGTALCRSETITRTWKVRKTAEAVPSLTISFVEDTDGQRIPYPDDQDTFDFDSSVYAHHILTNTGDQPLCYLLFFECSDGDDGCFDFLGNTLNPGESVHKYFGAARLQADQTLTFWYAGYDPETYESVDNPGEALCVTEPVTREWFVGEGTGEVSPASAEPLPEEGPNPGTSSGPTLTLTWQYDKDGSGHNYPANQDALSPQDKVYAEFQLKNNTTATLSIVYYVSFACGKDFSSYGREIGPGHTASSSFGCGKGAADYLTPGTETDELLGTVSLSVYAVGYDPATFDSYAQPGTERYRSETVTRTWKVLRPTPAPQPDITVTISADESAGTGKRVFGATVPILATITNTGECPVYVPYLEDLSSVYHDTVSPHGRTTVSGISWYGNQGVALLEPGETYTCVYDYEVGYTSVASGAIQLHTGDLYFWFDGYELYQDEKPSNDLTVPLTAPADAHPALTAEYRYDVDGNETPWPAGQDTFDPEDRVWAYHTLTNTGDMDLEYVCLHYLCEGVTDAWLSVDPLAVGASENRMCGCLLGDPIKDFITPGTETEDLLGTVTVSFCYVAFDPATWSNYDHPATAPELCRTETITRTWKVRKPAAEIQPQVTLTVSAAPDAGEGKRYEGAIVSYTVQLVNTGDCPVYVPWVEDMSPAYHDSAYHDTISPHGRTEVEGTAFNGYQGVTLLNPGESFVCTADLEVDQSAVRWGFIRPVECKWYSWFNVQANCYQQAVLLAALKVNLTDPPAAEPPVTHPGLTLQDLDDLDGSDTPYPAGQDTFDAGDDVFAVHSLANTGDTPLVVVAHYKVEGVTETDYPLHDSPLPLAAMNPGESEIRLAGCRSIGQFLTPGTETADLLGTVTMSFYYVGYDPDSYHSVDDPGPELCRTETVTRFWKVRKPAEEPAPQPVPEQSALTVSHGILPGYASTDPTGYRLGEEIRTQLKVSNIGPVDVNGFFLYDPLDSCTDAGGLLISGSHDTLNWDTVTVTAADVEQGYIFLPPVRLTWNDPDSGNEKTAYANPITVPVVSTTGLMLKKGLAKAPANGAYFVEGEEIEWSLTLTNISEEPIRNVTVIDNGVCVGEFAEIASGETVACTVPNTIVSEYDVLVGSVSNIATARGADLQGAEHTWPSNVVSVPTSEGSPIPLPPVTPPYGSGETPAPPEKGDVTEEGAPNGTPVGAAEEPPILTPLGPEMPDTPSFDPGAIPSGGDACALTVTALCGGEIRYTLHTCEEHAAVALQTGFMTRSGAAEKWREEINKLYDALYEIGDEAARAAVRNDQSACWAYVDAWAALYHDDAALCDMLRLRCAELCCVVRTAPDPLPDSILGDWAMLMGDLPADRCGRAFDEATGEIVITLEDAHRQALQDTLDLVSGAAPYARAAAIAQSNAYWQTALDHAVNIAYRNADRDARKLIVTWRMALDAVIETRTALLEMLYPDAPEVSAEAALTLFRDALIDACGHR